MTVLLIVGIIAGYALIGVIVGTVVSRVFWGKDIIVDKADADSFGFVCGFLWPASPFILVCFGLVRLINKLCDLL